jgi:ATP-binding cassette, subfamily B, multidrug efflux pump
MQSDYGYFEEKQLGRPYDLKLLRRLYPLTRPHLPLFILTMALVLVIIILELSLPYVTKTAIDRHIVPTLESAAGPLLKNSSTRGSRARFLTVDTSDPMANSVVVKYPDLFQRNGTVAEIATHNLHRLDKADLAVVRAENLTGVVHLAILFLVIILATFVFNFMRVMIMEYAGQMIMHDLRMQLFRHITGLPVRFFTLNPVGRLVTRVTNDVQNMHELFTSVITFLFKDIFLMIGIAAVLTSLDLRLALAAFTVLPLVVIASFHFAGRSREIFRVLRIKTAEINTKLSETIGGIRIIQLFLKEHRNYMSFKEINNEYYRAGMTQIHVFAIFMPLIEILGSVALAVVIYFGGRGVLDDRISIGALVAFISYMRMFFRPIRDLAEKYNIMQSAMASAERIFLVLDSDEKKELSIPDPWNGSNRYPSTHDRSAEPGGAKVTLENVTFGYEEKVPVLMDVTLEIKEGETVAIVGPTGSGKTSLINLIPRFYTPWSGRVLVDGLDTETLDIQTIRSKIALVAQDPFLFSGSIRENISPWNLNVSPEEMETILNASNCAAIIQRLPRGIETQLSEGGGSISSGERQLISIARAFARNPELIILDEATSYIDSVTEQRVQEAISRLTENKTTIIVAHRLSTARSAHRIIVLNRGRIIESGTHEALMEQEGFYFKLTRFQA